MSSSHEFLLINHKGCQEYFLNQKKTVIENSYSSNTGSVYSVKKSIVWKIYKMLIFAKWICSNLKNESIFMIGLKVWNQLRMCELLKRKRSSFFFLLLSSIIHSIRIQLVHVSECRYSIWCRKMTTAIYICFNMKIEQICLKFVMWTSIIRQTKNAGVEPMCEASMSKLSMEKLFSLVWRGIES